jgi:hypothetical protein
LYQLQNIFKLFIKQKEKWNFLNFGLKTTVRDREGKPETAALETLRNFDDNFMLWQYFGQFRYKPTDKFTVTAGLHDMSFSFNSTNIIEQELH